MEVCTNGKNCVLLSVLLYCYSSTLPGNASCDMNSHTVAYAWCTKLPSPILAQISYAAVMSVDLCY
jgi:hypothetical protein